jgi:GTP-binding protein Era
MSEELFKSGFIGLIGRTNVGKSTLINKILKKNVVITSDKAQTTRDRINCIYNSENAQAIFVDCPGFFKPRDLLGKKLNKIIYGVLEDVDIIVAMVDIAGGIGAGDHYVFEQIKNKSKRQMLLLNKLDLLDKREKARIPDIISEIKAEYVFFKDVIPISAVTGENINVFLESLIYKLPLGPKYYPDVMITDMPINKIIAEIVREKLSRNLFDELPHSINIQVENMKKTTTKTGEPLTKIECSIYAEKKSHKAMIIGKSGEMLKKVGEISRYEIENLIGTKVYLQLWVKIMENWTKKEVYLRRMGY